MSAVQPVVLRSLARSLRNVRGGKAPVLAGHKLLYRCNLECAMCPFWRRNDEVLLGLADEVRVMEALARAGVSFLGFEGGEPLLRHDLPALLEEAYGRFHTSLVTNGWLLEHRLPEIARHLDVLCVSLDGIGATHDRLRGTPRSFERAVAGIKASRHEVPTVISHTVTRENLEDAERVVDLAEALDVGVTVQVAYDYRGADPMAPAPADLLPTIERLRDRKRSGAPIMESVEYFDAIVGSWYRGTPWRSKPWLTINVDPSGRIVLPCYVLQEYQGGLPAWEVDIRRLWNSFDWAPYAACNRCALACYLEPSLFRWTNLAHLRERVVGATWRYARRAAWAAVHRRPGGVVPTGGGGA